MPGWEDLTGKMTSEQRPAGGKGKSNLPGRENSKYKGPEAGTERKPLGVE